MPNGVFGLSTALDGSLSYPCLLWLGRTFLFRVKVEMERAGLEGAGAALVWFFSGEKESDARLAEGVLLCEDCEEVPPESLVRRLALRLRCNWAPKSPMVDEMLCREACLRRGGVVSTFGGNSYWLGMRPATLDTGSRLMVGGVVVRERGGTGVGVVDLGALCFPPKKEGRREKMLAVLVEAVDVE